MSFSDLKLRPPPWILFSAKDFKGWVPLSALEVNSLGFHEGHPARLLNIQAFQAVIRVEELYLGSSQA